MENPLTSTNFVQMLYRSNYVQYKYLKEKADQRTYSYADLYVQTEYLGTYDSDEGSYLADKMFTVPSDATPDSRALSEQISDYLENSLEGLNEMRSIGSQLPQLMDYYAVDTSKNVSIGNSSRSALQEILNGDSPSDSPYVYYVYMSYDGAGNLANCGVSAYGNAGEFLKKVEINGRQQYFSAYDEDGVSYANFYNETADQYYTYKLTVRRPANMKIIYAMTEEQYQTFMTGKSDIQTYYGYNTNYSYICQRSYYNAGIGQVIFIFAVICAILGAGTAAVFPGKKRGYCYQEFPVCKLPLEANVILAIGICGFSTSLSDLMCSYQKGWFLENLNEHILQPAHMQWLRFILVMMAFFAYFMTAFTLGSVVPSALRFKTYFKQQSLLYKYWDRIVNYIRNFYRELVNFDIGTKANKMIKKLVIVNFIILSMCSLFWFWGIFALAVYSMIIYFLLKKYVKDVQDKYQNLLKATSAIARGDLDIALSEDFGVFESYKNELRQIQRDFKKAVDEEVKSQRMKSELITNVSHDLKTPLTAIITYINLLKEPGITPEQQREYIDTLDKKAVRLKVLIEDLFEVSKATTNNITLNYDKVDIGNLMRQCYLEYEDRIEEVPLQFKFMLPDQKVVLTLDSQKTFRIFENLYTNIVKYALPSTRVYVILRDHEDEVEIEVKNISRTELQVSPEELTERFVRGDGARNTEGSGLGLAIAKSFTELQHGSMKISVDGDLFKVKLTFRKWNGPEERKEKAEIK